MFTKNTTARSFLLIAASMIGLLIGSFTTTSVHAVGDSPGTQNADTVVTFKSNGVQDGWILESGENTNAGGTLNNTATTLRLGDDVVRKQYQSILSFNTSSLPDNAVITRVTLKIKRHGIIGGGNPLIAFQGFMTDVRRGAFGTSALQLVDWKATANITLGPFTPTINSGWYALNVTSAKAHVNRLSTGGGLTQIRLRFQLNDNNNSVANILILYSGNASATFRPQLIVEYH